MHILVAIVTVISALATWYYRMQRVGKAASGAAKLAKRVRNAPRKFAFMHRAGKTGIKAVDDPMEAGAILLVLMAGVRADREITIEGQNAVRAQLSRVFGLNHHDASDLITHATWMVRDVELVSGVVLRMTQIIKRTPGIGPPELVDLHEMLEAIGHDKGGPDAEQARILDLYRQKVGLTV